MVKKDRSYILNKTNLLQNDTAPSIKATLKSQLNRSEYLLLNILLQILQSIKQVNLESLANALPIPHKI
ncbi:hypothetical protein B6N60_02100 [Richelia sinica FACHB-800]|uniref:Uncharacterized protein n=1 Tax=Richelia sinica FACHB-800 TaxID=1357546 RepID=A0A975T7C3_9NOST|nr:hypothetical protein B6N60_02100 [Richelia sinica FACHB-800]